MKNAMTLCLVLFVAALVAAAQAPPAPAQASSDPLSSGQKMLYTNVKNNLVRSAEKMPEDKYSFKPVPEVRTFGQILGHVADSENMFCSMLLGEKNPAPGVEKNKTTKAELVQALKDSFAYCDKVYDGMTDAQAVQMVKAMGREQAKLTVLSLNTSHANEHYGNLVTYMRINGLVPPSSEPRQRPAGAPNRQPPQ
jgi:uncharacterized damage-inducible protein DinB